MLNAPEMHRLLGAASLCQWPGRGSVLSSPQRHQLATLHTPGVLRHGAGFLLVSALSSALVNVRLFRSSEGGLAHLRVRAFRHVHDLATLTQNTERRGALVSRVTSDVDTISLFVQWGGIMLLVSVLQIGVSTIVMATISWQLTIVVWACFVPIVLLSRPAQKRVSARYTVVREKVGAMLGAISESVVGAETIRAYGVSARTQRRIDAAIDATRCAMVRAQVMVAV
ncbi:MAG: ABC transporter transmembrane domain-containing protein, partial [Hydrogenophaga sp.]